MTPRKRKASPDISDSDEFTEWLPNTPSTPKKAGAKAPKGESDEEYTPSKATKGKSGSSSLPSTPTKKNGGQSNEATPSGKKGKFTKEEDMLLIDYFESKKSFKEMRDVLPGRAKESVRQRGIWLFERMRDHAGT